MSRRIFIFGCGGFGREVLQIILDISASGKTLECAGFIADKSYDPPESINGVPVYTDFSSYDSEHDGLVIAVGSSCERNKVFERIASECPNIKFAQVIHPTAWIGRNVRIGEGSIICAGCLITTDVEIGNHVHVNIGSTIGHDAVLGDFVTLNPSVNVSGGVVLHEGCEIGTGSIFIPKIKMGEWSITGAGAVVTKDMPGNITAVGVPAKISSERRQGWHR